MYEVTKDEHWKELHYRYLNEPDRKGVRRRDRIAAGMDDLAPWSAWFNSNAQYAVRELYRLETDPALRELYRKSLRTNAEKPFRCCRFTANTIRRQLTPSRRTGTGDAPLARTEERARRPDARA